MGCEGRGGEGLRVKWAEMIPRNGRYILLGAMISLVEEARNLPM